MLYEANPMAMVIEQAGGKALTGTERLMDLRPTDVHQRTDVVMGSPAEVDKLSAYLG